MRHALPLMVAVGLFTSGACWAQEAIATASNTPPPAPTTTAAPLSIGRHNGFSDEGPPLVGPCGAVGEVRDGVPQKPDKDPHGYVSAGVGTHGYREVGAAVCVPVGDRVAVSVAFDAGRIGR